MNHPPGRGKDSLKSIEEVAGIIVFTVAGCTENIYHLPEFVACGITGVAYFPVASEL